METNTDALLTKRNSIQKKNRKQTDKPSCKKLSKQYILDDSNLLFSINNNKSGLI